MGDEYMEGIIGLSERLVVEIEFNGELVLMNSKIYF